MTRDSEETPDNPRQRDRSGTLRERMARLEARLDASDDDQREQRRRTERLEARLWLLVTSAAGIGSAAGATAAQLIGG